MYRNTLPQTGVGAFMIFGIEYNMFIAYICFVLIVGITLFKLARFFVKDYIYKK